MDAQSHLMSLGWAGPGHPLHPSAYKQKGHRGLAYDPNANHTSSGLIKPLLVSKKDNHLGLGRRAHEPQQGNEWWLKGFEKALGDIGKSESERSSGVITPINGYVGKHGGLYSFFIRGKQMAGTIEKEGKERKGKKRKSEDISTDDNQPSEKKAASEFEAVASSLDVRETEEKERRKRGTAAQNRPKTTLQEEFNEAVEYFQVRDTVSGSKKKKQKEKEKQESDDSKNEEVKLPEKRKKQAKQGSEAVTEVPGADACETKEERRERRRRRKEEKAARRAPASSADGDVARAARKEKKQRQKAECSSLS